MQVSPGVKTTRRRLVARIGLVIIAILVALLVDLAPAVPQPAAPVAEQVAMARDLAQRLRGSLSEGAGRATIRASQQELQSAAALISDLERIARVDARIAGSDLRVTASRRLLGPFWLNVYASISPATAGFPPVRFTLGRLPLGAGLSHVAIATGAQLFRWRGVRVPPLDTLVTQFAVARGEVEARIFFPLGSGFANDLAELRQKPVDPHATVAIYCDLVALDRARPTTDFAAVVARAFSKPVGDLSVTERNRASFVALAMYTVEPAIGRFPTEVRTKASNCARLSHAAPLLATRTDLAKHWSLSAALSVSLGDDIGRAMGEWKELSDSRPSGSGFSFVDLAADRSGLAIAAAATDPNSAERVTQQLRNARSRDLLPTGALALSEGLSEADFVASYGTIDSAQFDAAKTRIDAVLARSAIR